ncbi:MAG: hypothetical protein KME22_10275 [Hassallia sp. WJT32-NPBG1]|jgi:hypothetical protein|nr:hypothetical protein [Hassallia sp. WJT32-NPBG1]
MKTIWFTDREFGLAVEQSVRNLDSEQKLDNDFREAMTNQRRTKTKKK